MRLSGRFEDRTPLMIPFYELPEVPVCVAGIISPRVLAIKSPRVAYYFGATVDARSGSVKRRYATSYVLEWAHAVAVALTLENAIYNRIWVCEERCVKFLRKFVYFEDFVVEVVGHEVAQVSFRRVVSLLEKSRSFSNPFLQNRVDFLSVLSVSRRLRGFVFTLGIGLISRRFGFCCGVVVPETLQALGFVWVSE